MLIQNLDLMDNMVRGLVTQEGEDWDNIFSENVILTFCTLD